MPHGASRARAAAEAHAIRLRIDPGSARPAERVVAFVDRLRGRVEFPLAELGDPVLVRRDQTGFIVNRILGAAIGEAIRLLESGQADAADIDKAMRLGCAWKMGPLETADLAGLDVLLHMYEAMQQHEPNPVLAPPALLHQLVAAGRLGRKSGGGFYPAAKPVA